MMSSLYIHIPFCVQRCSYCDFISNIYDAEKAARYMTALKQEIARLPHADTINTLSIGGGTPTVLPLHELTKLIHSVFNHFTFSSDYEATIEANPGTVDREKLSALRTGGVNRLSIGVQSFHDKELAVLGRMHSREDAEAAVKSAYDAGFQNTGIDLIYGIPGQDLDSWKTTLQKAVELRPQHISTYELTVEGGTALAGNLERGLVMLPEEERTIEMYQFAIDYLAANGYIQYEISNFARPGFACRHNINYWNRGEYFGAGLGAHSFTGDRRYRNTDDLDAFIKALADNRSAISESEWVTGNKAVSEAIFLGLRKTEGIDLSAVSAAMETDCLTTNRHIIHELLQTGLVEFDAPSSRLRLTGRGRLLSNEVFVRFL